MSETDKDLSSAYKLKKWGKDVDGVYIIDGYSYKGKKVFLNALEGFKDMFKKGFIGEMNGIKIKVLDTRINGAELAIEIECVHNKNRGIAVLKLYGPSTKNQNVVLVTKSKESDFKYVILLAEQIIEPMIHKLLKNEEIDIQSADKAVSVKKKKVSFVECPFCDKTSHSGPGLKGHITKMHKSKTMTPSDKIQEEIKVQTEENFRANLDHISEEAKKVVDLLVDEMVDITSKNKHNDVEIEEVTLDETCGDVDDEALKKYYNKCDKCEYTADAPKRYVALQLHQKHKESDCASRTNKSCVQCCQCEFIAYNSMIFKRHMRDEHNMKTGSISPPQKHRKYVNANSIEPMDTDDQNVIDLSESLEDMVIDTLEAEIMEERSKLMDDKISEKERIDDVKETLLKNKRDEAETKRDDIEARKHEQSKKLNKKRKQSLKDQRKNVNKKSKQSQNVFKQTKKPAYITNIKDVPKNCKHLVKANDVLYIVPGDGCCGPNCGAAFLFHDEVFGPKLRRKMNIHMAKHWNVRYKHITQCSPGHPFQRKLGNRLVRFTDPEKLIEFLIKSEKQLLCGLIVRIWPSCQTCTR